MQGTFSIKSIRSKGNHAAVREVTSAIGQGQATWGQATWGQAAWAQAAWAQATSTSFTFVANCFRLKGFGRK